MRSGAIRLLKIVLPLAATALIAALFLYSAVERETGLAFGGFSFDGRDGLRLTQPRFSGRTDDGQPFFLRAEWALPDSPDPDRVTLGALQGRFEVDAETVLALSADGGAYRPKDRTVTLDGDVVVRLNEGGDPDRSGVLRVARVDADLDAETLTAAGPVSGAGRGATVQAGRMRAARGADGYYIWFEERVRVTLDPAARATATGKGDARDQN